MIAQQTKLSSFSYEHQLAFFSCRGGMLLKISTEMRFPLFLHQSKCMQKTWYSSAVFLIANMSSSLKTLQSKLSGYRIINNNKNLLCFSKTNPRKLRWLKRGCSPEVLQHSEVKKLHSQISKQECNKSWWQKVIIFISLDIRNGSGPHKRGRNSISAVCGQHLALRLLFLHSTSLEVDVHSQWNYDYLSKQERK